ncbi:MAG: SCP2 sterol-binding domain-containing protein [Gammaproteobacteria bacterium]|nr:SCP2 sterol-binding domain-containing protein [Gammaproteobacteria bacterium]MCP5199316.1 SCP2 sterol-binding domain-containing protein [Gammaproteobacteria bacterium]
MSSVDDANAPGLARALNTALNRLLALDAGAAARLARIEGRTLAIELRGHDWRGHARVRHGELEVLRAAPGAVDVTVRGRAADFIALARANRRGEMLGAGRIEIAGDLAVAQEVQALLAGLDLDVEGLLARYVGDVAAHRLGRLLRGAADLAARGARKLERDTAEYLRYEARSVPARDEVEQFARAVFELGDAVDRAEARLRRLRERRPR